MIFALTLNFALLGTYEFHFSLVREAFVSCRYFISRIQPQRDLTSPWDIDSSLNCLIIFRSFSFNMEELTKLKLTWGGVNSTVLGKNVYGCYEWFDIWQKHFPLLSVVFRSQHKSKTEVLNSIKVTFSNYAKQHYFLRFKNKFCLKVSILEPQVCRYSQLPKFLVTHVTWFWNLYYPRPEYVILYLASIQTWLKIDTVVLSYLSNSYIDSESQLQVVASFEHEFACRLLAWANKQTSRFTRSQVLQGSKKSHFPAC